MISPRFFTYLLLAGSLALAPAAFAAKETLPVAAPIDEHDRLVQEFMAERAKLVAARGELKAKVKQAKIDKDTKTLTKAQDDAAKLEREFKERTADLAGRIKAKEDEKKIARPVSPKPSGG